MSSVGSKIDEFDVPVCNSFRPKIFNDQLCYELDLKKFSINENIEMELKLGFNFLMDYNEDRHIGSEKVSTVCCSVSRLSRFVLRMRAILLLCQSVGHLSEVLK